MNRKLLVTLIAVLLQVYHCLYAQEPPAMSSGEIRQALNRLGTLGCVMYVAAHPDDENTRVLSWLVHEKNVRVVYLSLTRGEGGQNLIGSEQGEELGLIRSQELLAARRIDGAEQYFTRACDFGYSKSTEETFDFWNRDSVLEDIVYAIRKFHPDVIINRFQANGDNDHAHHTVSAILSLEAFRAAADPLRFPGQLKYVSTWKARRIFLNTAVPRGEVKPDVRGLLQQDVGGYDPLTGISYGEISSASRSMHKSQGFGIAVNRGKNIEYFRLLEGDTTSTDLFAGINTYWSRETQGPQLPVTIRRVAAEFNDAHPEKSIPLLLEILKMINALDDGYWKKQKELEVKNLIAACSGLWMEFNSVHYVAVPGDSLLFTFNAISRIQMGISIQKVVIQQWDTLWNKNLPVNEMNSFSKGIILNKNLEYSQPYWLRQPVTKGLYQVADRVQRGEPWNEPAITAVVEIKLNDQVLVYTLPCTHKWTDPVKGERIRPVEIMPPVSVTPAPSLLLFPTGVTRKFSVILECNTNTVSGNLIIDAPSGWKVNPQSVPVKLNGPGTKTKVDFTVTVETTDTSKTAMYLNAHFDEGGNSYTHAVGLIDYDHIPVITRLQPARIRLVPVDLKSTVKKIGYIEGAGDEVAQCLSNAGFDVTILRSSDILNGDLSVFDAIVTGIRAFNTNEDMESWYTPMMHYVENGGTLVVQYNTANSISKLHSPVGPFPFKITRDRVTAETAPVTITDPGNILLNQPNQITLADFDGWVQERGIYFAGDLSPEYKTVLTMNDPGEKPLNGSLIMAAKGKGYFIYTGLSFFRELPAGVPGAWRLFVNLLHAGK